MSHQQIEGIIAAAARRQHGVWTRTQALIAGATPSMIRTRLHNGRWLRLDTAVYAERSSLPTWHRSVMAAVLAEPWAVASHGSAAVLHGLVDFRRGRPQITVRPDANARGRIAFAHRGVDVETTWVDQIPVSTLAQTFIDLAPIASQARLQNALSAKADRHRAALDAVRDRYCALSPRGGRDLRRLRAVLDTFGAGDLPPISALEAKLRAVLTAPALPPVVWEAPFPGRRPGTQRVDALLPLWSLIVEADGRAWHTRLEDFETDRRRDAEAAAAGLLTLRFTWHQLTSSPDWVRSIVVDTGSHRAAA